MPEIIRTRETRYRDDFSSDDERSSYGRSSRSGGGGYKTVQRYHVGRRGVVDEVDDDRRSMRSDRLQVGPVEIDRRVERTERVERPRLERPRSFIEMDYGRDREDRDRDRERERMRTVVYERDVRESDRGWDRDRDRWERETDADVRHRDDGFEYEKVKRETEYYARPEPPQPLVIRQRSPEPQKIIVQSAIPAGYELVRREDLDNRQMVRQEPREDAVFYRREVREGPPPRREYDDQVARYDRRDMERRDMRERERGYSDDERSEDAEVVVRKKKIIRERRSSSPDPHHKLHLAEGALAGAGAAALLANHREKMGRPGGRKIGQVAGGAAIGAIGTELITRAASHLRDRSRPRSRSRSRSSDHSKLKTGLGVAAVALAAAAAGKYLADRNADRRDEMYRGRSRHRSTSRPRDYSPRDYSSGDDRDLPPPTKPRSRAASIAKAGAGAAALAGIVEAIRNKSRERDGKRPQSKLRTGGIIAATGIAGAAVANLYENRKAKQKAEDDAARARRAAARSRSRSRARSVYSDTAVDPEMGMVEYGGAPVYTGAQPAYGQYYDPALAAAPTARAAYEQGREDERDRERSRSSRRDRSGSRLRDLAEGAVAAGAAAVGINEYKKRRERKRREREEARRSEEEASPDHHYYARDTYDDGYSPSPPRASGGAYYPEHDYAPPAGPPPTAGFTQHPNPSTTHVNDYQHVYTPPEYQAHPAEYPVQPAEHPAHPAEYPAAPAAYPTAIPPTTGAAPGAVPVAPVHDQYGYPPATRGPNPGENVSVETPYVSSSIPQVPSSRSLLTMYRTGDEGGLAQPQPRHPPHSPPTVLTPSSSETSSPTTATPHNKSVSFAPLSPTSSRRLTRRQRRNSDPSSDRPISPVQHRRRHRNPSRFPSPVESDEVEVLPDRFDRDGRPLDRGGRETEMVELLARDFGGLIDGRVSWRDLVLDAIGHGGGGRNPRR